MIDQTTDFNCSDHLRDNDYRSVDASTPSVARRFGQLVEVQGKEGHAKAAERGEQVLGTEGQNPLCKTLLTNVTVAKGRVVKPFRGELSAVLFL